uniref:RNA-dependent RNA polymerase n=1 Tax=Beauveria basiana dsRNA mycovirus 1 TaxID=3093715 RepID=A0AAF0Z0Q0_9VIRU|nr:MAG: RNA-dependent RNA polymerase [Beauveria basiana dsRNA mycovirus 1]
MSDRDSMPPPPPPSCPSSSPERDETAQWRVRTLANRTRPSRSESISSSISRSASADYQRAQAAKRRWEDMGDDDLRLSPGGSAVTDTSSRASYNTRRQRVWRRNHKASTRAAARLRHRPNFRYIDVEEGEDFFRHYRKGFSFAKPDPLVVRFVEEHGTPAPHCDPEQVCFLTACDDVQMNHLKYFDREPRELPPQYRKQYDTAVAAVAQMVRLDQKLPFPHAEDLDLVSYKARKYPGAYYRTLGYASRGEAHEQALIDAKLALAKLTMGDHVEPHTVRLGGRGKSVQKSQAQVQKEGKPKGRLILMLSQRDLLLCGLTEQMLTTAYCSDDYPMSLGMGWFKGNVTQFAQRYSKAVKWFCFDAAKFDSSLDPYLVRDVIGILREQFEHGMSEKYDAYWNFVLESIIAAPIQRDDGWIMHKSVGTTSGHNHNTLIQSICSLIIAYTNYLVLKPDISPRAVFNDMAVETLGDDNLSATDGLYRDVTVEDVAQVSKLVFGQDYFGDKSFATYSLYDKIPTDEPFTEEGKFQGVQYLGKFLRSYQLNVGGKEVTTALPYRPVLETFTHMYYPERRGASIERTYQRALGNLLDNYGNPWAADWLNRLLDWLEPQMELIPTDWLEDTVQDAARNYTAAEVRVPRPHRWTFEEWVALCLTTDDSDPEWFMYA